MLKVFRDNLKTFAPVLWLVIIAFIAIEFGIFGGAAGGVSQGAVASVAGSDIQLAEFREDFQRAETQYRQAYGDQYNDAVRAQVAQTVLDQLVVREMLRQEAARLGLAVSDAEVRRAILGNPSFQDETGTFRKEAYERMVRTPASYETRVRQQLLEDKLRDVLFSTLYVPDAEVERAYREQVERAALRYLLLPRGPFADQVTIEPAALEAYYQEKREELRLPERRKLAYLLVDRGLVRAELEVPDEELRAYYQENTSLFERDEQVRARHILVKTDERTPEQARAILADARRRLAAGEDFAVVAGELSEEPGADTRGGDLGYFGRGRMVPAFEQAVFGAPAGELLGPIETQFGLHLIEVTDQRAAGVAPFDEVREAVRARVAADRVDAEATRIADELVTALREGAGVERLRALAEERSTVRLVETPPVGAQESIPGLGSAPALSAAAFALTAGQVSDGPVETPRGPAVVYVDQVLEPQVPSLAEVTDQLRGELVDQRAQELAERRAGEALARLRAGADLDAVAAELGIEVRDSGEFGAGGPIDGIGAAPAVASAALAAQEGDLVGPLPYSQGALVGRVTQRTTFDPVLFETEKSAVRTRLEQEELGQLFSALLTQRRLTDDVRYNTDLLEQVGLTFTAPTPEG